MFKILAILTGIFNVTMAAIWYFAPEYVLEVWGGDVGSDGAIVERRLGVMIFFVGVLMLAARNAGPSPARSAISFASICTGLVLTATSVYDYWTGATTAGIVPGVGLNLAYVFWFALIEWFAYRDRKEKGEKTHPD